MRLIRKNALALAALLSLGLSSGVFAYTAQWTQQDWSGGVSASTAVAPGNSTGWTNYQGKDTAVTAAAALSLQSELYSWTVTDNSTGAPGFQSGGPLPDIAVLGSGAAAYLALGKNDAANSKWPVPAAPGTVGSGSALVYPGAGNYIYAFQGGTTVFWRYSITGNNWTTMTAAPGAVNSGGSLVYPGSGDYIYAFQGGGTTAFWRYSITGNNWTTMTVAPGAVNSGGSLVYPGSGDYIYAFRGSNTTTFWRYSITGNNWTSMTVAPGNVSGGSSFVYPGSGDYIYALQGNPQAAFWRYSITGNSWTTMANAPGVIMYGSLVYPGSGDYIYAFQGNNNVFWTYSISGDSWSAADAPANVSTGGSLVYPGAGDYIYGLQGNNTTAFWRYSKGGNNWATMAAAPAVNNGASLVYPGSGDYIYTFQGNSVGAAFWRYSISGNIWTTMAAAPGTVNQGGTLVYPGTGDYIYAFQGGSTTFWRYSITGNNWETMAAAPGTVSYGSKLVYPGSGDYIYALQGNNTGFWRYSITGNNWAAMTAAPGTVSYGGALVYPGSGDSIYAFQGNSTTAFWRYSITGNNWTNMPNTPMAVYGCGALVYSDSGDSLYAFPGNVTPAFWRLPLSRLVSGIYTSKVFDTGGQFDYYDISWSSFMPASGGNITVEARAGNTAVPDGGWTAWQAFNNGASLGSGMDARQYVQWRSSFTTVDVATSPVLYDLTLRYQGYSSENKSLVSSVYDTGSSSNSVRKIDWLEDIPFPTDAAFQLRTSAGGAVWTAWLGPDGTSSSYFTNPAGGETVPYELRDGVADRYYQYKVLLKGGGSSSPVVSVASVTYGSVGIPVLDSLTADSSTQVTLGFTDNSDDEDDFRISTGAVPGASNDVGLIVTADKPGAGARSGAMAGLSPNTLYYLRLRSHENATGGYSAFSNEISTYTLAALPAAAAAQYVLAINYLQVSWGANNNPAGTMYYPERATNADFTAGLAQPGWTSQNIQVFSSLVLGTTYYFRVKARNEYGIETATAALHAAQPVADPVAVADSVYQVWAASATVKWGANGNVSYIPYKVVASSTSNFAPAFSTSPWITDTNYTFTGLSLNTTYYFRVKSANPALDEAANWVSLGSTITLVNPPVFASNPVPSETSLTVGWDVNGNPAGAGYKLEAASASDFSVIASSAFALADWADRASAPGAVNPGGSLVYPGSGDFIYAFRGGGISTFWRYSISGDIWTSMTSAPGTVTSGGALVYPGSGDYIYAFQGNGATAFWRYSISGNIWASMTSAPGLVSSGGSLVYPGSGDYIYAFPGNTTTTFWRYSISGNNWANMTAAPGGVYGGGSLVYPGSGDYIYAFQGNTTTAFWRYSISGNIWASMTSAPGVVNSGGSLVYPGSGGYIYAFQGNNLAAFWRFGLNPAPLFSLSPMTTYYARAAAVNADGTPTPWVGLGSARTKVMWPVYSSYTALSSQITVNWTDGGSPAGSVEWYIERSTNSAFTGGLANTGWLSQSTTFYTFGGLDISTQYYFRGKAREQAVPSNESSLGYFPLKSTLPNAPSSLGHAFVSSGSVTAQWGANGNGAGTNYYAERATDSGFTQNVTNSGWVATLITGFTTTPNTFYYFRVKARNASLVESVWTNLPNTRTYANVPGGAALSNVLAGQAQFNWNLNNNPGGTEFWAEIATASSPYTAISTAGWITATSNLFTGLTQNVTYYFRVKARNAAMDEGLNSLAPALSTFTVVISTRTPVPPNAPTGLAVDLDGVLSAQTDRLHIKWLDNSTNETGFTLERAPDGAGFSPVLNLSVNTTEYMDTGLPPNTSYYYRVMAYSAAGGNSAISNTEALYTRAAVPNAQAFAQVSSTTSQLQWNANGNPGGTVYTAEISTVSPGFSPLLASSVTLASPAYYAALTPNTYHYGRIKATNGNGLDSAYSAAAGALTAAAAPVNPAFVSLWVTSMSVTWGDNGNPSYTRYTADISTASDFTGTPVSSATKNYWAEIASLAPNTTWYFRVKALNEADAATAYVSPALPASTLAQDPGVSAASYIVNATSVTVFWTTGSNSAWTQYNVQRSGKDSANFASVEDSSLWAVGRSSWAFSSPSLAAGSTYYFRVKARNSAGVEAPYGAGNWIVLPSTQTLANAPGLVPADVYVSSVNARWVNTNAAGTPYLAEISELSDYSVLTASSGWINDIASYVFAGLASNTRYYIRARARNTSGVETAKAQLYGEYTRAAEPGQPAAEYARTGNSVTVNWGKSGNPDPGTEYFAVASSSSDFSFNTASSPWVASNSYQFNGLLAGTTYYFRARARNRNSTPLETAWTVLPSSVTLPAPAPPSGISLAYPDAASTDRLNVLWNDNSADESGFRVYESLNGASYYIKDTLGSNPGTGPLSYLAMALSPNARYYYKVAAFNANGEAYTAAVSTYSRAAQPAALDFSDVLTNSLRANYGAAGNAPGTVYMAEISTMSDFAPLTASSSTVLDNALFTGIEANKIYFARVRAINGSGVATDYTALGSTQTIPLSMAIAAYNQAPGTITQGQRFSFAKLVITPSGNGAQLTGITVRRTGTGADADVSRAAVWLDQNADGAFQAGNDLEAGYAVFSASQAAISINRTLSAPATFFIAMTAADNYLSWPDNTIGVTITSTASFTSPNSILASMSPAPLNSGLTPIIKLADTLDIFGNNAAPVTNVSRGIYNTAFLKLTLNANRDRAYLNNITVNKLGTLGESNIAAVKVFYDANKNGTLEAAAGDSLISSGVDVFASSQVVIQLVNPSTRPVTNEVYFITLDIIDTAPLNATVGVRVANAAAFALMAGTPDSVTLAASPTDSAQPAVSDPPNTLMVTPVGMGVASIEQGGEKALLKLELTADSGNAVVTSIKVQRSSTSVDADYSKVSLYRDNPPLDEYGPSDTFISSGVFSFGQSVFSIAENITYTSTKTYFVVAAVSASANTSDKAGLSIQSGYITAISAQTAISAPFPIYSGLAVITPTVDTVVVTPDASIAPSIAYQTNADVAVLALKMQADANAADISAVVLNQAGTALDADISSVRVFKDSNGDGLFSPALDAPVSGNYGFSNGSAAVSFSSLQNITPSSVTYFVAASIAQAAVPGRTLQLRLASAGSFNILAPDLISSTFPIVSNVITLEKLPATVYVSTLNLAPASIGAGTQNIKMEKLLIRTNQSTSVMNSLSMVRAGGGDSDITGVALYWDANINATLEPSELVSSGTFSGGFLSLPFGGPAKDLSVSTKTYYVTMDISAAAAVNTVLGMSFTSLSVNSPDSVEAGRFAFAAGGVQVAEPLSQLVCVFENKLAPSATQGDSAVLVASVTLAATAYTVDWTGIDVLRTGNGYDSDAAAVKVYRDDGNGAWGGAAQETMVAQGTFAGGAANLRFSTQTVSYPVSRLYYIALDISETASPGKTLGVSIPAASYMKITDPDFAALAGFPFDSSLTVIQPTVDTLQTVPVPVSLAPLLTQGDYRRAIGKLTLRSDAHSIELSGIKFSQSGTMTDADLKEVVIYKDDGDGVFVSTQDAMIAFPAQPNGGAIQFLVSPSQIITPAPQTYWLAVSVSSTAAVGSTLSLDCANTTYLSITAPDAVDQAVFPFSFSVAGTLLDKPDTARLLVEDRAPLEADQGSAGNVMARLKLWTDIDQAVFNRLRVDLSGSVSPSDISAVKLYRDLDSNNILSPSDIMLASGTFTGGYVWLNLTSPQAISVSTRTFFVVYDVSATASINAQGRAGISGISYFDISAPDLADGAGLPFTSGGMTIKEPPAQVSISFENKASTWAVQGQMDVLMSSFTVSVSSYNAYLTQLVVGNAGSCPDSDVSVYLYADDGDRTFGGFAQETLLASAAFSGGMATLQFSPAAFNSAAPRLFYLTAGISYDAQPSKTVGFRLEAPSYVSVAAPDYLNPALVFPMATGLLEIQATSDALYAAAESLNLAPLLTQGDYRRAIGKITLQSGSNSVEVSNIRFAQTGTAGSADITELLVYKDDGDGVFVSSKDAAATLPAQISGGEVQLVFSPVQMVATAPQVYWLAVSVATEASTGGSLILTAANTAYFTISNTDVPNAGSFPLSIQTPGTLQDKPDIMRVRIENAALTSVYQGMAANPMARLKAWTDQDKAVWRRIRVDLAGNAVPSDVSAVRLYADSDGDGLFSAAADSLLASGAFGAGYAWLDLSVPQTVTVSSRTYFITYDFSGTAAIDAQAGAAVFGAAYFSLDSPDIIAGLDTFTSLFSVIRDPRVPVPPTITMRKADGSLSIQEIAYNPYETMLKFKWDGIVYQGSLEKAEYSVGPLPAASTSAWTGIGLVKDATVTGLNLIHGAAYYLSLRAKNTLGNYYSDIVSQRIVVDSYRPTMPASPASIAEGGGVKISWADAAVGPSGLAYYLIEERRGDSPVWVAVSTTAAKSLVLSQAGSTPSSIVRAAGSYFYRVSPVNNAGVAGAPTEPLKVNIGLESLAAITGVSIYPNPFDSRKARANITFTLSRASEIKVLVYDAFGGKVRVIKADGEAGTNTIYWDGSAASGGKVSKGMYLCVIKAAGDTKIIKIGVIH